MTQWIYSKLPNNDSGYIIDWDKDPMSVVVPEASENLVLSPSFEGTIAFDLGSWTENSTGLGATFEVVDTVSAFRGVRCCLVKINAVSLPQTEGVAYLQPSYGSNPLTVGATYTFSWHMKFNTTNPLIVDMSGFMNNVWVGSISSSVVRPINKVEYVGNGWYRMVCTFVFQVGLNPAIVIRGKGGAQFLIDAAQLELKGYETTYFDGDEKPLLDTQNPSPFYWVGLPHLSKSIRQATTNAGGRVINFREFSFFTTGISGLGRAPTEVLEFPYAQRDGSVYTGSRQSPRTVAIAGRFIASQGQLPSTRGSIHNALKSTTGGVTQPVLLRYQDVKGSLGQVEFLGAYLSGLDLNTASAVDEQVTISIKVSDPSLRSVYGVSKKLTTFSYYEYQTDKDSILVRDPSRGWSLLVRANIATVARVFDIEFDKRTGIVIYGEDAGIRTINPITGEASAYTGITGTFNHILSTARGQLFVSGLSSVSGKFYERDFSLNTWINRTGAIAATQGGAMAEDAEGNIYWGFFGGGAPYWGLAKWDGSAFSVVGTITAGVSNYGGSAVCVGSNGAIYKSHQDVSGMGLFKYFGGFWTRLCTVTGASNISDIKEDRAGNIYFCGGFSAIDGTTASIGVYNGASVKALPAYPGSLAVRILFLEDGRIIFTSGSTSVDAYVFDGASWYRLDVNEAAFSGATYRQVQVISTAAAVFQDVYASGATVVTNRFSERIKPVIVIKKSNAGAGAFRSVENRTSNKRIVSEFTLVDDETIEIDTAGSVTSSTGRATSLVVAGGSDLEGFYIEPGDNLITALLDQPAAGTIHLMYRDRFKSIEELGR